MGLLRDCSDQHPWYSPVTSAVIVVPRAEPPLYPHAGCTEGCAPVRSSLELAAQ